MRILRLLVLFFLIAAPLRAQVSFVTPLPRGILQVRGDHANLRLKAAISGYSSFSYKLSSDIDTTSPQEGWADLSVKNGLIDTTFVLPRTLRNYSIYWRTGLGSSDTGGIIPGLTPGHVIGIAGQSNAQGSTFTVPVQPEGDIRMLRNDKSWETAQEPTGNVACGPWIRMANLLYAGIHDSLPIGIINRAVGATGLTVMGEYGQWYRNPSDPEDTSVYGRALKAFRHAGSDLECLCWIQGEADGSYLPTANMYRIAFARLMAGFKQDLGDDLLAVFHLQIGGTLYNNGVSWPVAREAERILAPSTLVGTALGRPIGDGLHYTEPTLRAVGQMFAEAILQERYQITSTGLYPPLLPDTSITIDSILDGSIRGRYCLSMRWRRAGVAEKLSLMQQVQYFAIHRDGIMLDTSLVWSRISPRDSTRVLIGLLNDSISPAHTWKLTYDPTPGADRAPLATITASGDTVFGTAFYALPVKWSTSGNLGVTNFSVEMLVPNPTLRELHCYLFGYKRTNATIHLMDNRGAELQSFDVTINEGAQDIPIRTDGLPSGNYWIEVRDSSGAVTLEKAVLLH